MLFRSKSIYDFKLSKVPKLFLNELDAKNFIDDYDLSWMNESDRLKYLNNAESFVSLYSDKRIYMRLNMTLSNLIKRGMITDVNDDIPSDLVKPIRQLESEIAVARKEILDKTSELERTKVYVKESKHKVERQLEIIGIALRGDLESFSGIEYPEEIFEQTNVGRLREAFRRIALTN